MLDLGDHARSTTPATSSAATASASSAAASAATTAATTRPARCSPPAPARPCTGARRCWPWAASTSASSPTSRTWTWACGCSLAGLDLPLRAGRGPPRQRGLVGRAGAPAARLGRAQHAAADGEGLPAALAAAYVAYRQLGWAWHALRERRLRAHLRGAAAALPLLPAMLRERRVAAALGGGPDRGGGPGAADQGPARRRASALALAPGLGRAPPVSARRPRRARPARSAPPEARREPPPSPAPPRAAAPARTPRC